MSVECVPTIRRLNVEVKTIQSCVKELTRHVDDERLSLKKNAERVSDINEEMVAIFT